MPNLSSQLGATKPEITLEQNIILWQIITLKMKVILIKSLRLNQSDF